MKPPAQEPCCECCGAPIPALKWDGTYRPVIEGAQCAWCREPLRASHMHWALEDELRIATDTTGYARFISTDALGCMVTTVYGVRVGHG